MSSLLSPYQGPSLTRNLERDEPWSDAESRPEELTHLVLNYTHLWPTSRCVPWFAAGGEDVSLRLVFEDSIGGPELAAHLRAGPPETRVAYRQAAVRGYCLTNFIRWVLENGHIKNSLLEQLFVLSEDEYRAYLAQERPRRVVLIGSHWKARRGFIGTLEITRQELRKYYPEAEIRIACADHPTWIAPTSSERLAHFARIGAAIASVKQ